MLEKLQKYKKYKIGRLGVILFLILTLIAFVFGNKKGAAESINMFNIDKISINQEQENSGLSKYYDDFSFMDQIKLMLCTKYVFPVKGEKEMDEAGFLRKYKLSFVTKEDTSIYYVDMDKAAVVTNRFSGVYRSDYMLKTINDVVQRSR